MRFNGFFFQNAEVKHLSIDMISLLQINIWILIPLTIYVLSHWALSELNVLFPYR